MDKWQGGHGPEKQGQGHERVDTAMKGWIWEGGHGGTRGTQRDTDVTGWTRTRWGGLKGAVTRGDGDTMVMEGHGFGRMDMEGHARG